MAKLHYARLDQPQKLRLGSVGGEPIFASCATCRQDDAVIHGCCLDEAGQFGLHKFGPRNLDVDYAVYCETCWARELGQVPEDRREEPTLPDGEYPTRATA